ncbi:MAG: hypothetical protein JXR91_08635 [Deltaproteobacteria bacterium]|nr:hypothetical protein [Deltaproteobacteria bacterium]
MITKLTLTIDKDVIASAKNYAKKKHRSVSRIVEEYLKNVSDIDNIDNGEIENCGEITGTVTGMFKDEYSNQNYDDVLADALLEKYL